MKKVKILLVDDHVILRTGIIALLNTEKDFVVVGEGGNGEEAIELSGKLSPDILIIDLTMPGLSGIDAIPIIRKKFPALKILVLSMHETEEYIFRILKLGAHGYVVKNAGREEICRAIRTVMEGEKFFSPQVSQLMLNSYVRRASPGSSDAEMTDQSLTKREIEVLGLIGAGFNNQQIADSLFISARTVETHRTNIMQKLDIHDTANLVKFAIEKGISPISSQEPRK